MATTIHKILKNDGILYVGIYRPLVTPALSGAWETVGGETLYHLDIVAERLRSTLITLDAPRLRLNTDGRGDELTICCERVDDYVVVVAVASGHPISKSVRRMIRNLVKSETKHGPGSAPTPSFAPGTRHRGGDERVSGREPRSRPAKVEPVASVLAKCIGCGATRRIAAGEVAPGDHPCCEKCHMPLVAVLASC